MSVESKISTVLITGGNAGLGTETARKLASEHQGVNKIYLACRNPERAKEAKKELKEQTKRDIFEVVIMDLTDLTSVKDVVAQLEAIDAVVMNAGGPGEYKSGEKTNDGVSKIMALNVLGHVVLLKELIKVNKLKVAVIFSSSEAACGIPALGFWTPKIIVNNHWKRKGIHVNL